MQIRSHVLRAPDDGGDGGAAGAAAAPAAAPAPAADAPAAAPAPSALASGAAPIAPPAAAPAPAADPLFGAIPAKFHTRKEDGTPDLDASWAKVETARAALEKRLGAGDVPPAAATDYKLTLPDSLKDAIKLEELGANEGFKAFTEKLHAAGLSQKQYDMVMGEFLERGAALRSGMSALDTNAAVAALREGWKTDAEFDSNVRAAYRAGQAYAGSDFDGILKDYGNDPRVVRMLANVGKELAEDTSAGADAAGQVSGEQEMQALAASPAYFNPADPQHAIVKAKVTAFYEKKYGTAPKSNGSVSIGSVL